MGLSLPFFTATNLFGPFWMSIIILLVVAFLLLDFLGQNMGVHPYLHLIDGTLGLACLLIVPGIFCRGADH